MSAHIRFDQLWTYKSDDSTTRVPLEHLSASSSHIHGRLQIEIAGRPLPALGYFGPDDVCLNTWIEELLTIKQTLSLEEHSCYTFDEGEQGQPAYEFRRESDLLFVSVKDSQISGADGDPSYQDVSCLWQDFNNQIQNLEKALREFVAVAAGEVGVRWWSALARRAA